MSQHNNYKIRECMKTYNIFVFWARLVNQNIAFGELIQNIILLWLIISISKSTIVYLHNLGNQQSPIPNMIGKSCQENM